MELHKNKLVDLKEFEQFCGILTPNDKQQNPKKLSRRPRKL